MVKSRQDFATRGSFARTPIELNPFVWHHTMTDAINDHNYDFQVKDKL